MSPALSSPYNEGILDHPSYLIQHHSLEPTARALLAYERAKAVGLSWSLSAFDLLNLTPKFWNMHTDPIHTRDISMTTILTIQLNLCCGTLVQFSDSQRRRDLDPLIDDLLKWRKNGQFMLTEVGHGLDVDNLETEAILQKNGDFILNSPTPSSCKYMPPTVPAGLPTVAVVFARLLVKDPVSNKLKNWGVRPFVVPLNDGKEMCQGVTSKRLPYRELANPVNHSITRFTNVRLPQNALLGPLDIAYASQDRFFESIWRVAVGSIALGGLGVPISKVHTYIGAKYSLRRHVGSPSKRIPLLTFRTQQVPVLTALAKTYVLEAFQRWAMREFSDKKKKRQVRHAIAIVYKAVAVQIPQGIALDVMERCGAQGVQAINQISTLNAEMRGVSIAEGDVLVLSLKLAMELLLEKYDIPQPQDPSSLLARHEAGLIEKYRTLLRSFEHHRSPEANAQVTPHTLRIVEAIGHRMAYDAAVEAGVDSDLISLFEATIVRMDEVWYSENIPRLVFDEQQRRFGQALDAVLPRAEKLVDDMGVSKYVYAPIATEEGWEAFVEGLETFNGAAKLGKMYGPVGGEARL